jgi:hypothetical protein
LKKGAAGAGAVCGSEVTLELELDPSFKLGLAVSGVSDARFPVVLAVGLAESAPCRIGCPISSPVCDWLCAQLTVEMLIKLSTRKQERTIHGTYVLRKRLALFRPQNNDSTLRDLFKYVWNDIRTAHLAATFRARMKA